jgi:hypothetical protein
MEADARGPPRSTDSTNAFSAPAAAPAVPAIGGPASASSGRAVLLRAHRWILDSRDEASGERLDNLEDPFRLYRRHTILIAPRPARRASTPPRPAEIKKMLVERQM